MFVQRRHPLTGETQWVLTNDLNDPFKEGEEATKKLLAMSFYLDMLNDTCRNRFYRKALQNVVRPGDWILDVGTGSGILSLMAAQFLVPSNASRTKGYDFADVQGQIVACEAFSPMARLAQQVTQLHGLDSILRVLDCRSDDLDPLQYGAKFDVVVTEIFDSELIGEGIIPTMRHVMNTFAKKKCKVIPARADLYCQIVESPIMRLWKETNLRPKYWHGLQECDLCRLPSESVKPLSQPIHVFEFELNNLPNIKRETNKQIPLTCDGVGDALVFWWVLDGDGKRSLTLSTQPKWIQPYDPSQQWRQHWKTCWAPLPSQTFFRNDVVQVRCMHDDYNISTGWNISNSSRIIDSVEKKETWLHYTDTVSYRRRWEIADPLRKDRCRKWLQSILSDLEKTNASTRILILGEGCIFMELLSQLSERPQQMDITFAPETIPGYKLGSSQADLWNKDGMKFYCIQLRSLLDGTYVSESNPFPFGCIISEPYFWEKESDNPWMHYFMYKHCVEQIKAHDLLTSDCRVYPSNCRIFGCAVSLPDLYRTRSQLKEVEDWDLSLLNSWLGAVGYHRKLTFFEDVIRPELIPLPSLGGCLWHWGDDFQQLTHPECIFEDSILDFDELREWEWTISFRYREEGTCHGILIWPEYTFQQAAKSFPNGPVDSPGYTTYGICLLPSPFSLQAAVSEERSRFKIQLNPKDLKFISSTIPSMEQDNEHFS